MLSFLDSGHTTIQHSDEQEAQVGQNHKKLVKYLHKIKGDGNLMGQTDGGHPFFVYPWKIVVQSTFTYASFPQQCHMAFIGRQI